MYTLTDVFLKPAGYYALNTSPNPAGGFINIKFGVPEKSQVTISIFDAFGNKKATIADRTFEPGSHKLKYDVSNLPSGYYFYEIKAPGYRDVKSFLKAE